MISEKKSWNRNINDIFDNVWEVCSSLDTCKTLNAFCLNLPRMVIYSKITILVLSQHIWGQGSK